MRAATFSGWVWALGEWESAVKQQNKTTGALAGE